MGGQRRWRVLIPRGLDKYYDDLVKAKNLARQYEGAQIQERYGNSGFKFVRYVTRNGRVTKL